MSNNKMTPALISRSPNTFWRYWAPPLCWAVALLIFSGEAGSSHHTSGLLKWILSGIVTLSPEALASLHNWMRWSIHVLAYGILSVLWFRALAFRFSGSPGTNVVFALVLSLAVALLDEGHQALVPSRDGSLGDVALDMAGAALLTAIALYARKRSPLSPPEARPPSP